MSCLEKHAPLENLRFCDRSMQSLSCADGCLAGDVYLCFYELVPVAVCPHMIYSVNIAKSANTGMA